jgi:glycosyltransferase involved in cell wall biosynthesis
MKKVIWISSYLPRNCGIAYYSSAYIDALKKEAKRENIQLTIKIISHIDAKLANYPIINLKNKDWINKVYNIIIKESPDVVHIQHEYGLYETNRDSNENLLRLLELLKKQEIKVVMTYHTVYEKLEPYQTHFIKESLKLIEAGIFHEEYQKKALKKNIGYIPSNVYVLPHGSKEDLKLDKEKIRKFLNHKEEDLIVGMMGIAGENKGFEEVIDQWPRVIKKFPNAILTIELKPHAAKETRDYIKKLLKVVMSSPVSNKIEFIVEDYSLSEFYTRLKSFDCLILPYKTESQSGVLAHAFSAGTPTIVSDIEGLSAEIKNSNAGIRVKNRNKFYRAINKMLKSKRRREKYSKNAINYVKTVNGWNIIAKKTLNIYHGLKKNK